MKQRIRNTILGISVGIIFLGSFVYGYWYFIDGTFVNIPLRFNTNIGTTDKVIYHYGDPVGFRWNYCKGVDTTSRISVNLVDGLVYFLPSVSSNRTKGCYDDFTVVTKIPEAIPKGTYYLTGVIHFRINPIKNINYTVSSTKFIIE